MCVSVYVCTHIYRCLGRLEKGNKSPGAADARFVSYPTRLLALELWSSGSAASILKHGAVSPAPGIANSDNCGILLCKS